MENLHAFLWSIETIKEQDLTSWRSIQIVFELSESVIKLLGLPAGKEHSMYTAYWASNNKKRLRYIIPDEAIIDYCKVLDSKVHSTTYFGGLSISGKFGLHFNDFNSYKEDDPEVRIFDINEKTARENNVYLSRNLGYHRESFIRASKELSIESIILSSQAKFFITCLIGHDLLWNGRDYKFRVMQYSEDQKQAEIKELIDRQLSWVEPLCKMYELSPDHPIVGLTCESILSKEPTDYE